MGQKLNRSNFLKIVTATPFAFKALLLEHGKEHIEKYSDDIETIKAVNQQGLILKKENKVIALASVFSVSTTTAFDPISSPIPRHKKITIDFGNMRMSQQDQRKRIQKAFENDEIMDAEIYEPTIGFMTFKGEIIDLTDVPMLQELSGTILVRSSFNIETA